MLQRTEWKITAVEATAQGGSRRGLDVRLVVDTTAPAVVQAIEHAAREQGIVLERVDCGRGE